MNRKSFLIKNNKGFLLVEIVLTVALFSLVVTGTIYGILFAEKTQFNAGINNDGVNVAEDSMEIVRNLRDEIFPSTLDIIIPICSIISPCGLIKDPITGAWSFVEGENGDDNSFFHRTISIVPTGDDPSKTREIIVNIWPTGIFNPSFSITSTLTTWNLSSTKKITEFSIPAQVGNTVIDEENKTINITMPFETDVSALIASFVASSNTIVKIGEDIQENAITENDFTNPVTYTVIAQDLSTVDYTVTVSLLEEV